MESFLEAVTKAPIEIWKLTVEIKVQAGQACRFGKGHIIGSGSPEENQEGMDVLLEHSMHFPELRTSGFLQIHFQERPTASASLRNRVQNIPA